jgi:hypothetical protein
MAFVVQHLLTYRIGVGRLLHQALDIRAMETGEVTQLLGDTFIYGKFRSQDFKSIPRPWQGQRPLGKKSQTLNRGPNLTTVNLLRTESIRLNTSVSNR